MSIILAIPAPYRKLSGGKAELTLTASDVRQAIASIQRDYPELAARLLTAKGSLNPYVSLYLNGNHLHGEAGLSHPLKDGDRLLMMPVVGGGH
jgi:molybdopterin converting factor small subunit